MSSLKTFNLLTWNTTGIMSSCSYLVDVLRNRKVDICGISEHWLFEKDLHFSDKIDNSYKSHSIADSELKLPGNRKVGKGGVALLWKKTYDNKITILPIESDRIIGVQYEITSNCFLYIIQVFMPSKNHSIYKYRVKWYVHAEVQKTRR